MRTGYVGLSNLNYFCFSFVICRPEGVEDI
jgi:hypothetical protein